MDGPTRRQSDTTDGDEGAERGVDGGSGTSGTAGGGPGSRERTAAVVEPTTVFGRVGRTLVPGPIRRNYALKFAVAMLVVILLITVVGGGSYLQIRGIIETDAENTLQSTATLQADSVSEWMSGMRAQVRGFAGSDVFASGDSARIEDALDSSLGQASSDVVGLHYVAPNGTIIASTAPALAGRTVDAERPRWRDAIADSEAARPGEWQVGTSDRAYENNGRLLMAFASPVRVGNGVLVLVGDVRADFEQLHRTRSIVRTQLLNPDGYDVFAPRQSSPSPLTDSLAFSRALDGETTVRDHGSTVFALSPVRGADWVVVTEAPKSDLYQASETVGRNVVFLVAASITTLAVVGFVLGRGTVLPLIRLRKRAQQMERGDLDVDLATSREDEIGRLFLAFDNMRAALKAQIRDATEARERAEQSRRDLKRQNDRLDQFASTVSHDLRNPLNVASGHLQLIDRKLDDLGAEAREALASHTAKIDDAHQRMESIIQDVLALARQGQDIEETQSVDLGALARDAWATVDSGPVAFDVVNTRTLEADPDRLRQALENLFRNAVEHGTPDGVETDGDGGVQDDPAAASEPPLTVEVGGTADGFYVADDGSGIPSDAVEDVFEYGHTTNQDGTGFGLAIVETIVDAHGWSIEVDETSRDGAKFVITGVDEQT